MSAIHEMSSVATLSEFDLFGVPPTQISVTTTRETEHRPLSVLNSRSPIEFHLNPSLSEYILMSETYLRMGIRIKLVNTTTGATAPVGEYDRCQPVQNILHSMFKSIEIMLGNKLITLAPQNYAYRAYLETLLGYAVGAKQSYLKASGHGTGTGRTKMITPEMAEQSKGRLIELMGPLHTDLTFQNRAILGGTPMRIKLIPNDPSFYFDVPTGYKVEVIFETCSLMVTTQDATGPLMEGHNRALQVATAKYPITRTEVHSSTITAGSNSYIIDNLITSQLPRRLFVMFVKNNAFNGVYTESPYYFPNHNINFIATYVNGVQLPAIPYQPNFGKKLAVREYLALYRAMNQNTTDPSLYISYDEFLDGKTIFGFQYSPDLSNGCGCTGHLSPITNGNLRLHVKFSTSVPEAINVVCLAEYDNIIEIDQMRNVTTDYN
ncbi:hypothetical protein HDE_09787 [Halotydeus destructor]|nr:hypothetical protein HDE_09787 [Halotydeus destructor]